MLQYRFKKAMPQISAVIITLNEEKNLGRCLESLLDVVDEIVVVDSFSTDKTEEIARSYGARFIQHTFEGYIEQKNWATDQATYDYILSLDADEMLSDTLKNSILKVKNNWTHDGYTFNRLTNYCGRWIRYTSWYPSRKLRLYDRRKGQWEGINPHDAFVMQKGSKIKHLKGDLLHYSFYTIGQQINQINRFSELQSMAFFLKGYKANAYSIVIKPLWRFFRDYFIKLGILDGFYGFVISVNGAYEVYLKYLKLKKVIEIEKNKSPYRVCFFTSRRKTAPFELQYLQDIKAADIHKRAIILFAHPCSNLIQKSKKIGINYITQRLRFFLFFNPFLLINLIRIFTQLRVRAFVVNNKFDAQFLSICSSIGLKQEIYFHLADHNNISRILNFLEKNRRITKVFVSSENVIETSILNYKEIIYLKENKITSKDLQHHPKVAILLDKLHNPNCGLGRVSIDFSRTLTEFSKQNNSLEINYLIYGKTNYSHLKLVKLYKINDLYRVIPAYFGHFDVIHLLHQTPSFHIAGGNKKILTIHDLNFLFTKNKYKSKRYLRAVQHMVNKADAVVFISNFTREICEKYLRFFPHQILRVIYNGVDLPSEEPIRPTFINENTPFLFTIGQCLPKKNFHVLLPFLKLLEGKYKLIIAGENNTSYGAHLRGLIHQYQLKNEVIMPGPISESEKRYLYQHCAAFVFPSVAEGFGLPVIEAMLNKKPVFCSDKTSLKEIGDGHVFFWRDFDPLYMSDVFEKGMNSLDTNKLEAAYNYAQQFTWQKNVEAYYQLYQQLIGSDTN